MKVGWPWVQIFPVDFMESSWFFLRVSSLYYFIFLRSSYEAFYGSFVRAYFFDVLARIFVELLALFADEIF